MKKILISFVTVLSLMFTATPVKAANTAVTFEGDKDAFVIKDSSDQNFEGMAPGETRNIIVDLKNEKDEKLNFYLSVEIPDNIAEKGNKISVYDFNVSQNDEEPFFKSVIGATNETTVGKEYLTDDNRIKLATLNKGESTSIKVSLHLDGDSTEDEYQNQTGEIKLRYYCETYTEETPKNVVNTTYTTSRRYVNQYFRAVATGDPGAISSFVIILAAAGCGIIYLVLTKKKKKEEK